MSRAAKRNQPTNPFYVLLVIAGIAFTLTACSYGLMSYRELHLPSAARQSWLMATLQRHGGAILAAEVGLLAVTSLAAMATDRRWYRRSAAPSGGPHFTPGPGNPPASGEVPGSRRDEP